MNYEYFDLISLRD